MEITRTGIELGPITIYFYGVLIVTGIIAASSVAAWMAKKDGKDPEQIWNGLVWAVIGGVIGARLWFVFFPPVTSVEAGKDTAWMLTHPLDLNDGPLAIWNGGLGIFGAVIGGFLAVLLFARKNKLKNLWEWIDIAAVVLPLGQAIGRWGNYVNQELYGKPTDLPWAITIDNPPPQYANAEGFHPLFLYESLWNLGLFAVLFYLWRTRRHQFMAGDFMLMYVVGYSVARFFLEFLRVEIAEIQGLGINSSQTATAVGFLVCVALLIYRRRRFQAAQPKFHPDGRPVGKPKKEAR